MIPPLGMPTLLSLRTAVPVSIMDKPVSNFLFLSQAFVAFVRNEKEFLNLFQNLKNQWISSSIMEKVSGLLHSSPKKKIKGRKYKTTTDTTESAPTSHSPRAKSKWFVCEEHQVAARLSKIQTHLDVLHRARFQETRKNVSPWLISRNPEKKNLAVRLGYYLFSISTPPAQEFQPRPCSIHSEMARILDRRIP